MDLLSDEKLFYNLALTKVEGVGPVNARKIVSKHQNVEELFRNKKSENFDIVDIPKTILKRIKSFSDFEIIEKEVRFIIDNKIKPLMFSDPDYPENLKHCFDAPFMIFTKGNINFKNDKIISIVGTRNISAYGLGFVKELMQELKKYNPLIISGYAYGVDIAAHLSAIENNLQTVAILGNAFNQTYPKTHFKYNESLLQNGGFITEFSTFDSFNKENFIKRNRIVAGLSKATIIIESAIKGGSLSTAKFANDYNREVFALPGKVTDLQSQGCNHLIKTNQANLISSVNDLVYLLNWDIQKNSEIEKRTFEIPANLSEDEIKILYFLNENGSEILDILALKTDIPVYKLNVILLNLELQNLIVSLPGKLFDLKK